MTELTPLFSELGSLEDFETLIHSFVNSLSAKASAIRKAVEKDPHSAVPLLHKLQGAAGGYGYPAISRLALALENKVKAGALLDEVEKDLNDLDFIILRVRLGIS